MRIGNGICYPDAARKPLLKIVSCRALSHPRLRVRFDTGEIRDADLTPLLALPAFATLADEQSFHSFSLDHGIVTWLDGDLDIGCSTTEKPSPQNPPAYCLAAPEFLTASRVATAPSPCRESALAAGAGRCGRVAA